MPTASLNGMVARRTWAGADMGNSVSGLDAEVAQTGVWPRRYTVVALLALATAICYVDRVNISIAIIPLARDRGYDAAATGLILSSFFWGYIGPQMLGGWLADRFGGKRVLTLGVLLWSLGTLFTPAAAEISFGALLVMRAALGLGESVRFSHGSQSCRALDNHLRTLARDFIVRKRCVVRDRSRAPG